MVQPWLHWIHSAQSASFMQAAKSAAHCDPLTNAFWPEQSLHAWPGEPPPAPVLVLVPVPVLVLDPVLLLVDVALPVDVLVPVAVLVDVPVVASVVPVPVLVDEPPAPDDPPPPHPTAIPTTESAAAPAKAQR
jgi:hypothetical protein